MLLKFTGEVLRITHIARGLDSDGALLLDVVVNGHVLQLQPLANVNMKVKPLSDTFSLSLLHTSSLICIKEVGIKS